MAEELSALGYEVHTGIAKTGVVALLRNGAGLLVMMRADMDALPVKERSGLPYASQVIQENLEGSAFPGDACLRTRRPYHLLDWHCADNGGAQRDLVGHVIVDRATG